MARGASGAFVSALAARRGVFPLFEFDFATGTEYACGLNYSVTWNGSTYLPALGILSMSEISETGASVEGVEIRFSGVTPAAMSLALSTQVQGRGVRIRLAAIDSANAVQVDSSMWTGIMDFWSIDEESATITLACEHRLSELERPRTRRLTDAQQQALYPGDLGCQYALKVETDVLVWPGKVS
jgi:hypothetical protein